MIEFFKTILYEPLLNLLVIFYNFPGHDLGVAIVILTIVIKLIFIPLSIKSTRAQKSLRDIQPKLDEIKKKYPDQKEKQAKATMNLYKENKINPASSCLPLLVQLPVLIVVYQVFRVGLTSSSLPIYSFIQDPGTLNLVAFGFLKLAEPNLILAVITAVLQYLQVNVFSSKKPSRVLAKQGVAKDENMMTIMNSQMKYMMPILTIFIGATLPSGLMLYWLVSLLFSLVEQKIIFGYSKKIEVKKYEPKSNN